LLLRRIGSRGVAASLALVLAAGMAGCGGSEGDSEEGAAGTPQASGEAPPQSFELQIGNLLPLTGDLSAFGPPGRKAADLAVEQIEAAIEEVGADVQVSIRTADTETADQAAVQSARQLASGGAGCIAGPWASSETIAVGTSVAARQRVPIISPSSTSAEITGLDDKGFVFRVAPSDDLQAVGLADTVEEELGGTDGSISLAARNDAYGEGFINAFKAEWEERGGTTTGPVLYDPQQPSYNSEAGKIVEGDPDAYLVIDFPETYAKMGAALSRTGDFDAQKLFTADGLASDEVPEDIPAASLEGARGTRPGTPEEGRVADQFNEQYTSAPGPRRQTFDAQNFDATMLCFLAAAAAGSGEGSAIAEQLQSVSSAPGEKYTYLELADALRALQQGEDIDFDGVTGPIDFDDNGDPTTATYEVWQYQDDGSLEILRQFEAAAQE
jgi:ABC-type branched-subunit amino acid transport system substrate-binding protein